MFSDDEDLNMWYIYLETNLTDLTILFTNDHHISDTNYHLTVKYPTKTKTCLKLSNQAAHNSTILKGALYQGTGSVDPLLGLLKSVSMASQISGALLAAVFEGVWLWS